MTYEQICERLELISQDADIESEVDVDDTPVGELQDAVDEAIERASEKLTRGIDALKLDIEIYLRREAEKGQQQPSGKQVAA